MGSDPHRWLRKLTIDHDHFRALFLASLWKRGRIAREDAPEILDILFRDLRLMELTVKALRDEPLRSDLSETGIQIVRAWYVAAERCGFQREVLRDGYREYVIGDKPPSLFEVRREYARLFLTEKRPRDMKVRAWLNDLEQYGKIPPYASFRDTLTRCQREFRLEKPHRTA